MIEEKQIFTREQLLKAVEPFIRQFAEHDQTKHGSYVLEYKFADGKIVYREFRGGEGFK